MEKLFETALFTRTSMLSILENKSSEELVKIPVNFRNSVFWNIAHVLVTQQLLCYRLSGLDLKIREDMVTKYGKGSLATESIDESDILYVKDELVNAMKNTIEDYKNGMFKEFKPYLTSTGIELKTIDDALGFSTFHDGIHLGVVLSLMKII
mgnify:CR=1 FL=1